MSRPWKGGPALKRTVPYNGPFRCAPTENNGHGRPAFGILSTVNSTSTSFVVGVLLAVASTPLGCGGQPFVTTGGPDASQDSADGADDAVDSADDRPAGDAPLEATRDSCTSMANCRFSQTCCLVVGSHNYGYCYDPKCLACCQ